MTDLVKAINSISNTVWGIMVLVFSMFIAVHFNKDIGIYFAGVGSTLLGLKSIESAQTKVTTPTDTIKVDTNASNSSS